MEKDKRYGLQLRVKPAQQKKPPPKPPLAAPLAFRDDDDDNVEREISRQAYKNNAHKDVEEQHKKALEEDPSVFDYDGVYDEMKQKSILPRAQDRQERKPKYIQALIEKAKIREREHEIVYERKLAKERSKEDHMYADKDKFVTSAYKRKLAEQAKWLEEERLRELREERDDVTKKSDISDFYFNLSKNVAFGGGESDVRKAEKHREKVEIQSPEKVQSSTYPDTNSSGLAKGRDKGDSPAQSPEKQSEAQSPKQQSEDKHVQPVSDSPKQDKAISGQSTNGQPKQDHHKRKEYALAAAKERFLARKRAKEQIDFERAKEQIDL